MTEIGPCIVCKKSYRLFYLLCPSLFHPATTPDSGAIWTSVLGAKILMINTSQYVVNYRRLDGTLEAPKCRAVDNLFVDIYADYIHNPAVAVGWRGMICLIRRKKRWKMRWLKKKMENEELEWKRLIALLLLVRQSSAVSKLPSAACQPTSTPSGHSFNLLKIVSQKI